MIFQQSRRDRTSQAVTDDVLDASLALFQCSEGGCVLVCEMNGAERDENVFYDVSRRSSACNVQVISMLDHAFWSLVRFFEPHLVRDGFFAVVEHPGFSALQAGASLHDPVLSSREVSAASRCRLGPPSNRCALMLA